MKTKFTTICSRDKLSEIRGFLSLVLNDLSLSDTQRNEIILAVDEACANAMIHGNNCDETKPLHIEVELLDKEIRVEISDTGTINIPAINEKEDFIENLIRKRKKGGLGLRLIHSIMDKVDFYKEGTRNICALTKQLK